MRKVTEKMVSAFKNGRRLKIGNTFVDENAIYLHGNKIAKKEDGVLWITAAGWKTKTTKERLNGLPGVSVSQKNYTWYLNGKEWSGEWINVQTGETGRPSGAKEDAGAGLRTVAMVAKMGDIFHAGDQKASNDWKARMLKAGLENKGLIMPEDWDSLSEDEKETRLNGVIAQLK